MKNIFHILTALLSLSSISCNLINPPEEIPSYIYIPSYDVVTDTSSEGSASANLTDVWVSAGGRFLGTFELPALVPILENGNVEVVVRAGVKENGISAYRAIYPFYESYFQNVELAPTEVDTISPVFTYKATTKFAFVEGFEGDSLTLKNFPQSTSSFHVTKYQDSVFEGSGSLVSRLTESSNYLQLISKGVFPLPINQSVWLEMNYKTEVPINVGVVSTNGLTLYPKLLGGVNKSDSWKKVYFNLAPVIQDEPIGTNFVFYLESVLADGQSSGIIQMDNIKLLYF